MATRLGTEPQPPPEKEDEHLTYEQVIEQLGLERESRRLAEEIVEDVERERDEARSDVAKFQKQLDELETARASLAKRAERLEKDLKAKPEADPEASRKLEETRAQLADALRRGDDYRDAMDEAVALAKNEPIAKLRAEVGAVLVGMLKATDGEPGHWLLSRLDALTELEEVPA